jgi:superfamily II DNA or RNA helicase
MDLRPYQRECVEQICARLREQRSTVAVLATGLGKTVVFSECVRLGLMMTGRRALILAHREELVMQAAEKVKAVTGLEPAIEMADYRSIEDGFSRAPVVVSSIQTMNAGRGDERRMHRFRNDHPWFVVVDECHHAPSASYKGVIAHFMRSSSSRLLGVTATPDRLDKRALGQVFESVAYTYDVADGIRDGWLVPIRQRFVQCDHLDLSGARKSGGDFQLNDLEEALERSLQEMILPTVEIAGDRRTLIFAATVKHAERVAEIINRPGVGRRPACIVHGGTPKDVRRQMFREYSEGKYQYLVNVGVATEGWDDPAHDRKGVQIVAMMRPTQSRALYSQMLGRGTRSLPGTLDGIEEAEDRRKAIEASAKPSVLVLDFLGNSGRHQLVHSGDVLGGSMDEKSMRRYRKESEQKGVPDEIDVLEMLDHAEKEQRKAEEAKARAHLVGRASFSSQDIDPFERFGIVPRTTPWWQRRIPPTVKQREFLTKQGIPVENLDTGKASQLIDAIMSQPSDKQAWVLRRAGIDPKGVSRKRASELIDMIKTGRADEARNSANGSSS